MEQTQQQGDRRQSQVQYQGEDRRRHDPIFDQVTLPPGQGMPGMSTQERKDQQAERTRQQRQQEG